MFRIVSQKGYIEKIVPYLVWSVSSLWIGWWIAHNPLPDGYQNEYLHVGNAFDLYSALIKGDWWHVRWYAYTSYWPFGFYVLPVMGALAFGKSMAVLVYSHVFLLAGLLWAMRILAKQFESPYAPYLLLLTPACFGSMTRFEPNFANITMMAIGLVSLLKSEGFSNRRWSLLWGLVFGISLMLDRLTMVFYLGPAGLYVVWQSALSRSIVRRNVLWSLLIFLGTTVAYYREFFLRHTAELLTQAPVGEIDSAGELLLSDNPVPVLYYVLSILDSQAGLAVGFLMLWGVIISIRRTSKEGLLFWSFVPGVGLFTIVAKKQVYYTFPILVPLAIFAGRSRMGSLCALVLGTLLWMQQGCGLISSAVPISPRLPERLVAPTYLLARPPTHQSYDVSRLVEAIEGQPSEILVFSQDQQWYEGFVVLQLRQYFEGHVRGVTADPIGVWEFSEEATYLVWVRPISVGEDFPVASAITMELISDHYQLDALPPVSEKIQSLSTQFVEVVRWTSEEDSVISLYKRIPVSP